MSVSGDLAGYSTSLQVDMNKVDSYMKTGKTFGSHKTILKSGGVLSEPISLKLLPIDEALSPFFYHRLDQKVLQRCAYNYTESRLKKLKANVLRVLKDYPRLKEAVKPGYIGTIFCHLIELRKGLRTHLFLDMYPWFKRPHNLMHGFSGDRPNY